MAVFTITYKFCKVIFYYLFDILDINTPKTPFSEQNTRFSVQNPAPFNFCTFSPLLDLVNRKSTENTMVSK